MFFHAPNNMLVYMIVHLKKLFVHVPKYFRVEAKLKVYSTNLQPRT